MEFSFGYSLLQRFEQTRLKDLPFLMQPTYMLEPTVTELQDLRLTSELLQYH